MIPLGSGDTSHNHSESVIQQPASGTSTLDTPTTPDPSKNIQEFTSSELTTALSAALEVVELDTSKSEDKKEGNRRRKKQR